MEKQISLKDLLAENAQRLYNGAQYAKIRMPFIRQQVSSPQLKKIIGRQMIIAEIRQDHMNELMKLLQVFRDRYKRNRIVEYIIESAQKITEKNANNHTKDAVVLSYLQQLSHYELAEYGTACSYADILGFSFSAYDLQETLAEEREINLQLTLLAEDNLNVQAEQILHA